MMKSVHPLPCFSPGQISVSLVCLLIFLLSICSVSAQQSSHFGWARQYGNTGQNQGKSIQADNIGNTYLAGSFQDSIAFDTTGSVLHSAGGTDALLAKFNPAGQAVWAKNIGGAGEETGIKISLDKLGNLYITGSFSSPIITIDSVTLTNSDTAGTDIFLAKFDTAGTLLWAKTIGSAGNDAPTALGADAFGNSYLSGYFSAANMAIDTTMLTSTGGEEFFLTKHDAAGNVLWSTNSGSVLNDRSSALAVDSLGTCLLTGFFTGDTLFFASDTLRHSDSLASPDIFLLKYNAQGQPEWAKSAGTDSTDISTGICLDADGFIYLAGKTNGTQLLFDSVKVTNTASQALFLVRLNPEGKADWEATAPVSGSASGWELASDIFGSMYLMTDFTGQLEIENNIYHDSTGSRLVFSGYNIFRDFEGNKQATGTGMARGFGICSNETGNAFAAGSFTDSLSFDSLSVAILVDSLNPNTTREDIFISSLNGYGNGSGDGTGGNGNGYCQMIREVIETCGVPGDEVLIRGIFLGKPSAVAFGGIPAQIVHRTFISVTAIVPQGYVGGPVAVTVNSCTDTAAFGLMPIVSAVASAQNFCANTPVTLTAAGADFYQWSTGQADTIITVSPAVNTTYTVTGTIGACQAEASVSVQVDTVLAGLQIIAPTQPICEGSAVTLVAQGATSYSWSTGQVSDSITVNPTSGQTFTVFGSAGACTDTATVFAAVQPFPAMVISPSPASICLGDSITLTASGAETYTWWGGGTDSTITVSPDSTTLYTVTGTIGGCSDTATVAVQVNFPSQLPIIGGSSTLCEGEILHLTASGAVGNFIWSGPGGFISTQAIITVPNVTVANSGTYSVQLAGNACQGSVAAILVQVNPAPTVTVSPQTQTILPGAEAQLTASGATVYVWLPGNISSDVLSVSPATTTQYQVIGTTAAYSDTATAIVNVIPLLISAGNDQFLCEQNSTTLSASISPSTVTGIWSILSGAGGSFSEISSPTAVFSGLAGQHYQLLWQAGQFSGPATVDTVSVHFDNMPDLPVVEPVFVCENSPAMLVASGSAPDFVWYKEFPQQPLGNGQSYITPALSSGAVYYVTAKNQSCETAPVAVPVGLHLTPVVEAGPDLTIVSGKSAQLLASGAAKYSWSPSAGLSSPRIPNPMATPAATTTYTVAGTSDEGCQATDFVTVTVLPTIQPANVFTPNGDGINDYWEIGALTELYPDCHVEVFNRWGNKVYSSKGYQTPWNGKNGGHDLPSGTFFYSIDPGHGHEPIKGMVILTR